MIQVRNVSLTYGDRVIFDNLQAAFDQHQRIGVVGRNGAGKTTFLKILAGEIAPDEGAISFARGKSIAYMPQEIILASARSVFDEAYSVFDPLIVSHADMLNTERVLKGLGFDAVASAKPVSQLSVGWRMRVVLAKLLLQRADFYLFDEPTNHLDIVGKEWFITLLQEMTSGYLLISHDRYYLERTCDYIFEIERGKGTMYTGNFTSYVDQKESERLVRRATYERQHKEMAQKQATIDRFRAQASKSRMAQSMIKKLDKVELVEPEPLLPTVSFSFPSGQRPGQVVLSFDKLSQKFGERQIFSQIGGRVERGEKIAIIAANGVGKTTLLNLITGKLPRREGEVEFGYNVQHAVFEQDQLEALRPENTVYEEAVSAVPEAAESRIRAMLGAFLFSGDASLKKVSMLSGGERSRLALAKVLLERANFLILDEPTNHLDIYSKEVLVQALKQYDGTVLMVCHDHDVIERACNRIFELTPTALHSYQGTYDSYKAQKAFAASQPVDQAPVIEKPKKPQVKTEQHKQQLRTLREAEQNVAKIEKRFQECGQQFADCGYGTPEYKEAHQRYLKLKQELTAAQAEWEKCYQESQNS